MAARKVRKIEKVAKLLSSCITVACPEGHVSVLDASAVDADRGCYCKGDGGIFGCDCPPASADVSWRCSGCVPVNNRDRKLKAHFPFYTIKLG